VNAEIETISEDTVSNLNNHIQGSWVRHDKEGFTLIEVIDTSSVLYFQFIDRKVQDIAATENRYWYYKSKATAGYWNSPNNLFKTSADIWIQTDRFRFDYKISGDTLIEVDKMGDQGKFVKVNPDNP
jgi:hypothetical protein